MTKRGTDIARPTRLLQLATDRGEDVHPVLARYANERLLYRLVTSARLALRAQRAALLTV